MKAIWVSAAPKGIVFATFRSENRYRFSFSLDFPHFVWKWVLFSRKLRECINVFVVSIPNEAERKSNMRIRNEF